MITIIHPNDLEQLQQYLLASYFYLWGIGEYEAAEEAGELFDRLYHYDNSHDNITNALNWKNDD